MKRVSPVARKPGLSYEVFVDHWLQKHAPLRQRLPRLSGCRINVMQTWPGTAEPWDGMVEQWFDSLDDMQTALPSGREELIRDMAAFSAETRAAIVTEHVLVGRQ